MDEEWRADLETLVGRGRSVLGEDAVRAALAEVLEALDARPARAVEPLDPPVPVLGVDGCKVGWVGVLVLPGATVSLHVGASIAGLVEHVREQVDLAVVAIDIPIGLPERNGRTAESLVRAQLPGRASSVFSTATRATYLAADYDAARAASIATTDSGTSVSRQSWALGPKVLEVDAWIRTRPRVAVIEAHPELSFARLAGVPVLASKHTAEGLAARRDLLAAIGLAVPPMYPGMGFDEDDLLDACVLTWTATRHVLGTGERFPDPPELLDGLEAAIHV